MRRSTRKKLVQAAGFFALRVAMGLVLQVALFYWLYGVEIDWAIPNLRLGFKYYLDLLQLFGVGLASLAAPLVALGCKLASNRIPLFRKG